MLGYRAFRSYSVRGKRVLFAVYKEYEYKPGRQRAECHTENMTVDELYRCELHWPTPCTEIPGVHKHDGGCGFYFYRDADASEIHLKWLPDILYGLVWASGKIVEHDDGVCRAEYIEVLALAGYYRPDEYDDVPFLETRSAIEAFAWLEERAKEFVDYEGTDE